MKIFRHFLAALAIGCSSVLAFAALAGEQPPNIIIILADDLGWGDLGCYGHPGIRTPNLDRLAAEGMRFTDFYSAAEVCTPSRAALLTGRYPIRSGMCHNQYRVLRNNSAGGLPASEITLPQLLKTRGYATACVGKWHLGHLPQYLPTLHGFDSYFGLIYSNDMKPAPDAPKDRAKFLVENNAYWKTPLFRDQRILEHGPDLAHLTRRYTDEAVKFIHEHRRGPFFLYFAHTFPHVPLFASERFHGGSPRGLYGDVVEELDWSVGQVLEALKKDKLERRTFVFFTSDNGPWLIFDQHGGSAGPFREGKGSTWEGGMRVPGIAWAPGRIPAGLVQRQLASMLDLFPTFAKLAGAAVPTDRVIDGLDISPLLFGHGKLERDAFFYYRGSELYAARQGPWKAHFMTRAGYGPEKAQPHEPPLLIHLGEDPGERFNVVSNHTDVVAAITQAVERHRATLTPVPSQLEPVVAAANP